MTRILIVDDHKIVRDGIKALLEDVEGIHMVGEAESGEEAIEHCEQGEVDLVIMDINMPDTDGIEATRQIRRQFPEIRVLALSMLEGERKIRDMIQAGADGYVFKNTGRDELLKAIEQISAGKPYFSSEATLSILKKEKKPGEQGPPSPGELTDRETEVLQLIGREFTNKEIAEKLHISVRTVDAHRRNLLQKTGARNTAGLVRYAMNNDLI